MKKKMKKLKLAKETVRELDNGLTHVAGGLTVVSGCNYCPTGTCCTCLNGCDAETTPTMAPPPAN
jgi:hypothetical protein